MAQRATSPASKARPSRLHGPGGSTIASWSATIIRALDACSLDGVGIARRAGIESAALEHPDGRVSRAALTRLWELAIDATGDESFGLTVARYPLQTTFHALGYAVLASATLREAFERIIRYRRLIGDVVQLHLEHVRGGIRFVIDVSSQPGAVPSAAVDAFAAVMVRQVRTLTADRPVHPQLVSLQRAEPDSSVAFERVFRAPVKFSQPSNFLEYSHDDVERRLPAANAEIARQNEQVVERYLSRLHGNETVTRVEQAIVSALTSGEPSKQAIAQQLAVSARTLQRQLAEQGTTFTEILDHVRLQLARSYLDEGRLQVTEIAFMLGFADSAALSRAFRRWTGRSPRAYAERRRTGR